MIMLLRALLAGRHEKTKLENENEFSPKSYQLRKRKRIARDPKVTSYSNLCIPTIFPEEAK